MNINLNKKLKKAECYQYKLYILVRNDLPSMNPGKAMAQVAHAANQFIHEHGNNPHVKRWQSEGNGFGTTITLSVNIDQLDNVVLLDAEIYKDTAFRGMVTDTTYPYIVNEEIYDLIELKHQTAAPIRKQNGDVIAFRSEDTCGYVFVIDGSDSQKSLVGDLSLHP